jgi:hypothetical protein
MIFIGALLFPGQCVAARWYFFVPFLDGRFAISAFLAD